MGISAVPFASVTFVPDEAYMMRPYASRDLIKRPVDLKSHSAFFAIDPWTRCWAICSRADTELLDLCDGRTRLSEIIRRLLASPSDMLPRVSYFLERGLLFVNEEDHRKAGTPVYNSCEPVGLHLEITNACNMTCTHCYVSSGKKRPNELTLEEIYKTIDMLPAFSGKRIAISGGEPAVRKDCADILEYCAVKCGHDVDLYTNGKKFPAALAEKILQINRQKLGTVRIQLSLEGANAISNDLVRGIGSFNAAMESLRYFQEIRLNRSVVIFVCLTKSNIHEVDPLIRLAEDHDVAMLVFSQWQRQGNANNTPWRSIAPSMEEWVAAGEHILSYQNPRLQIYGNFFGDLNNSLTGRFDPRSEQFPKHIYFYNAFPRITPEGDVFADQLWVDPDWVLGNVRSETLAECFQKTKFYEQLNAMRKRVERVPECQACPWVKLCEAGSPGHTYAEYGNMYHRDVFCESRIYWFEHFVTQKIKNA